jgi:hypothetical protein
MKPEFDLDMLIESFVCIQREIFANLSSKFSDYVLKKNTNLYKRASNFSQDFNNCNFDFDNKLSLNRDNFFDFCNFTFDFMNYVRKIDQDLFDKGIEFAQNEMNFSNMPTLDMIVKGCGQSMATFLEKRENGELDNFVDDENEGEDEDGDN